MAKSSTRQLPLQLRRGQKTDVRAQFAALCWRMKNGKLQICLVTSRRSGRWIVPKGWPMPNQTPAAAAATEAYEEAGLSGHASDTSLGVYSHVKMFDQTRTPIVTMVYPVHILKVHKNWPEKGQRRRKWFSAKKAAKKLSAPELRRIVATFRPQMIGH